MTQEKKKLWVPKKDFRTRFAERDLEISVNEYKRLREEYLESQRKKKEKEEKIRKELEELEAREKENKKRQAKEAELKLKDSEPAAQVSYARKQEPEIKTQTAQDIKFPSIQDLADKNMSDINSFLNRKIESKTVNAPLEKKESYIDINIPSITSLVDDYTKPVVYNTTSGMFEVIDDSEETISYARDAVLNRPTPQGLSDYENRYLRETDPVQRLKNVRERYNILRDPVDVRNDQQAKGTFWEGIAANMMTPGYAPGQGNVYSTQPLLHAVSNAINPNIKTQYDLTDNRDKAYIDDVISTWSIGKNNAEFDAYVDAGIRLGEKKQYANIIQQYSDNINDYIQLQNQFNAVVEDPNVSDEAKRQLLVQMNNILTQNEKLRPSVEEAITYKYSPTVSGSAFKSIRDFFFNVIDGGEFGKNFKRQLGIKGFSNLFPDDIGSYGKQLLDLADSYKLNPGLNINEGFLNAFNSLRNNILSTNRQFLDESDTEINRDKELALRNKQEALDWEEWHTPSKEFKAKEKASQANYLTDFDTYKYGMWGVLGSSASFNGIQLLSTGLNWLGAGLLMAPNPYAKAAGAAATAAGAGLGIASGVYENRAEVAQNYIAGLRNSLQEKGLLKKFLDDGKTQLEKKGIKVRDDEDVFRHFILKDYTTNHPVIQELATRHLFGANNAFQNDMMAVSADVAFNAGLNVFGATGKVAEALKILPQGSKYALLRKVADSDLASSIYHATAKLAKPNIVASALSPLANIPYNVTIKPGITAIKGAMKPMIKQAATYMARAAEWARIAPESMFKGATIGKYVFNFLGKQAARGFSEAIEEGKQYEYGKMFSEGKFAGKSNSILSTLIDDLSTGLYTGMAFIGSQFFGVEPDKELMANMRGGFLGGVLNSGAFITAGQNISNAVGEIRAGDMFFNNAMAEKLRQRSNIVNGEEMAKYTSRTGYTSMMNAMDRIERLHESITESSSDKIGLSKEYIEEQRKQFRRIAAIANSVEAKARAKELGIKQGSDQYRTMVSLMNVADQIQMENIELFNSLVEQAQQKLSEDGLTLNVKELFDKARTLAGQLASENQENEGPRPLTLFEQYINSAEEFAKWFQPLNNQVAGQYNALNRLIEELESREGYLTRAEIRNLNHYKALRDRLDKQIEDLKQLIGGLEGMQMLNNVPQDILEEYSSIYRTLFQASAQLETSTVVLNNLWGKNNARESANEYVADELDFINSRIEEINKQKDKAVKKSKKSARDAAALEFIEQYKKSVEDDIELMAEIANRFERDEETRRGKLNGTVEELQDDSSEQQYNIIDTEDTEQQELEPQQYNGVQGLPNDTTQLTLPEALQFPVGTTVENINEPGNKFTIQDVKINPSTGQFLLEAKDNKGNTVTIDEEDINQYQKALPAPYHFETVFQKQKQDSWLKFKKDSPLVKAFDAARNTRMPSIIGDQFRQHAEQLFKARIPRGWEVDSSQYDRMESLMIVDSVYRDKMVEWNPIYGAIYKNNKGQYFYIPSYAKFTPEMYPDFRARRDAKLKDVKRLTDLRDSGKTDEIKALLEQYNINSEYINVLNDNAALMSIAEQIAEFDKPSVKEWLAKRAMYMDLDYLLNSPEGQRIFPKGTVVLTNIQTDISNSSAYLDAVTIDENGTTRVYIFAFPSQIWSESDLDVKGNHLQITRRDYYTQLANDLFATLDPHMQLSLEGMYVLPINELGTGTPIKLDITTPINNNTHLQRRASNYALNLIDEIGSYISKQEAIRRSKPEIDGDGSPELTLENIISSIELLEQVVQDIYSGKYSFNGKIRSDVRQYLDNDKHVLNKYRTFIRGLDLDNNTKNYIDRIEKLWDQITNILSTYRSTDVYNQSDMIYEGETIDSHRPIIPSNHPLSAVSTSGIPVTASSDFITNGKVELMYGWYNPQTKEFVKMNGYSTHPGVGVYAVFTYNETKYDPVLVQPAHYKAGVQPYTQKGAQFIMDVISMQNSSEGLPVVASARRLIPNPRYNGPMKPILEIQALNMTLDDVQEITGDSDNVGITNSNNNLQLINRGEDKSVLWKFRSTLSGSIFLLHSFNFNEYVDGGLIPVKLIPAKLDKSDVDVIISILKANAGAISTGFRGSLKSKYEIDGKETPITNEDVLKLLTTYTNTPNNTSLFYVDDFGKVFFRQRQSDPEPQGIDVLSANGEAKLRQLLSNGYEIAQNREVLNSNLGNQMDPIFAGLKKWVKENGSLVISKNLVFDEDDVDRNGKGFSGIGWSIKHGRLLSNLSGIYDPSISLSDPKVDDGTTTAKVESFYEEEKPQEKEQPTRRAPESSGLLDTGFEFGVDWYATEELPEETLDEDEAREDIISILGETAVQFVDDIICILSNGLKALGATLDDVIILSRLAGAGTQFHEAFHRVLELLVDDKTRNRIYKAFSRLHPEVESNNTRSITEGLAEDFKAYARREKESSRWEKFWRRISEFITTLFNADKRVLYKMYRDVYRGKYKNIKPSKENIERFNRIFAISEEDKGVLYHTIYDASTGENINLPNVPSDVDYRDAIDTVVNYIVSESGSDLFGSSVAKIKLSKEDVLKLGKDGSIYKNLIGGENPDDINRIFRDIFDNWDHVLGDVALSLKRFGLHFKHNRNTNEIETYKTNLSEAEQEAKDAADEGKAKSADINQYELADYEISKIHKMSERTKYFFATIPNIRFVEEYDEEPMYVPEKNVYGEEIDAKGRVIKTDKETGARYIETKDEEIIWVPSKDGQLISTQQVPINMVRNTKLVYNRFGFPEFAPFHNTCKVALNRCYSANSLEELLLLFKEASVEFPVFVTISQRFEQLLNNIKLRGQNGYYIAKDNKKYRRLSNGLFQEVLGKNKFGDKYYTVNEIDFKKNRNNQAMAVSVFNNISGTRLHFFNIRSTRPSPNSIIFQRMDTEGGYAARKYTKAWHSLFLNDIDKVRPIEVTRKGELIVSYIATNKNLFKNVANELRIIVDSYTNRRSAGWTTGEVVLGGKKVLINRDPEAVKAYYLRLLNLIGITVTAKEFNHLLFELFGKTDIHALRKYFQQDGEDYGATKGVSISKFILAIEQGIQEDGEYSRTVVSGSLYTKVGAVTQLADGIWSYRQTTRDLMTRAPGKNRYYQVANRNVQDIFMQDLNDPQSKMLRDFYSSPYHRGSIYIDALRNGYIALRSNTNAGYISDNKSDFGQDFMSITDSEDIISKITLLLEGDITPPTLSNKKTYQPIQIIDTKTEQQLLLPGISYVANKTNAQESGATAEVYNASNVPILIDKPFIKRASNDYSIEGKEFVVSEQIYDALIKYAFSEYYQIKENVQRLETIPDSEKVVNYDTAEKGAKIPGALRFSRFYEVYVQEEGVDGKLHWVTKNFNNNNARSYKDNLNEAEQVFFGNHITKDMRKAMLTEIINRRLQENLEYLVKKGIIKHRVGWRKLPVYARYEPVVIDTAHLNAILKQFGSNMAALYGNETMRSIATCAFVLDVMLKHQIALEEYQRLFVGNPNLFVTLFNEDGSVKNDTGDLSKRLGGHMSTGETQCSLDDVPEEYTVAELKDYKTTSSQQEQLKEWFEESESRFTLYADVQKEMSIYIQNLRSDLVRIARSIYGKSFNSDGIISTNESVFNRIEDEDWVLKFATKLATLSHIEELSDFERELNNLKAYVDEYKMNIVSKEYDRQNKLNLDQVKQELDKRNLLTGVNTRAAAYAKNFDGRINVADGASFVSPVMVKYMLMKIGKFTGKVEKAWESLVNGKTTDPLANATAYKEITNALFGTQKYTATGYRMNNGQPITYYTKSAFFPLFRQIAHGRTKDILDKMEADNVMMLCFESAKKFGSQGKQHFPTTAEQLSNFHFNVYKENFKYLRKQLNTDPKEDSLQSVGSLTKKVALTILDIYKNDYVKRDGTVETGKQLQQRIFDCEKSLSSIGFLDLMNRFSTIEEKSKYLRDNLGERDADSNMLQALSLIVDPETKQKRMRSKLEAASNSGWIQSIITALANKHIVDINLPGSAFIQRSVYAMEDNTILGDNEVYGIPKLHISNDWSSMDAVVSIDYFYQFFPFLEEMSFNEAREWLIKHNIIGENAKAETVAYRIPTQANSSIHALRFIDVISTVRDTIILPEEFTAITGSDFDIDKLFLSSKFWFYDKETDTVSTEFNVSQDPMKHFGNELLECYLELLSQDKRKYANQLVRSIDYDTSIPKQVVDLLQQGTIDRVTVYQALQLWKQCQLKSESRIGGIGVAFYALNNNNEIMTMQFEVEANNIGLIKALDISRLYDKLDAEGNSVMATIGAFITGHVDINKDPWVGILNVNEYTYDTHLYLARAGMGLRSLWFCSQPIIRKCADVYIQAGGYLFDKRNESKWLRIRKAFNQLEDEYILDYDGVSKDTEVSKLLREIKTRRNNYESIGDSEKIRKISQSILNVVYAIQQIFGVSPENPSVKVNTFKDKNGVEHEGTILQDIALHHNSEEDISDTTERYTIKQRVYDNEGGFTDKDIKVSTKDVQIYVYFANIMIDDAVQDMKNLVQYSKIETKKQGKNRAELLAYNNKYEQFFALGKTKIMLPETVQRMAVDSGIDTKQNLFMQSMTNMLGTELLSYTPGYEYLIKEFITKSSLSYNKNTVGSVIDGLTSYQKWEYIEEYARINKISIKDLFVGSNSIYNDLMRFKQLIIANPEVYPEYTDGNGNITNELLASLQPSDIPGYIMEDYGSSLPKFVDFGSILENESNVNNDIIAGWLLMLHDTKHKELQTFAKRLIVYSFITSGDTNKPGAFFNLVPFLWREEESKNRFDQTYVKYVDKLINDLLYEDEDGKFRISDRISNEKVYELILRNNWFDDDLVPTIQETSKDNNGNTVSNYFQYTVNNEPILISLVKFTTDLNGVRHFIEPTIETPKLVIKLHNIDAHSYNNPQDFKLYRFVRMGTIFNNDGEPINFPIYGRISQIGGLMYGHYIINYRDDLDMSWERDTKWYTDDLDLKMKEGIAQIYDNFEVQFRRNEDQIAKGVVTRQELKLETVKTMEDVPVVGSYEDGTPIQYTRSNAVQYYDMIKSMASYYILFDNKTNKIEHNESLRGIKKAAPIKDSKRYSLHSGGAPGADSYWGEIAKQYGVYDQNHYYSGEQSSKNSPYGNVLITAQDYEEGRVEAANAAKYNWGYGFDTMKDDRLVRNWSQVKYADAVFAIGHIANPGDPAFPNISGDTRKAIHPMVQGGTGYAVGMAILHNKPVYVFDQVENKWFAWDGLQFNPIDTPTLTLNFAGIGTRQINENGKQAIKDVFENTFKEVEKENSAEPKKIDIWSTNHDRYANLSNVAIRSISVTPSIAGVVNSQFGVKEQAKHLDKLDETTESNIINRILRLAPEGFDKFNSVEQLFLLIKFEAMKEHVREKAKELYGLSGVDIAKGSTEEASAIKSILNSIKDKQVRIFGATGSKITSISHEQLPDINDIVHSFWNEKWNQGELNNVENSTAYNIMREIMLQSFLQNIGAAKLLLSTEDAILTHEKGSAIWKEAFPKALMDVRREISENYDKIKDVENKALTILGGDKVAYEEYNLAIKAAKEGKTFSDVQPFFTPEEVAQIQQAIPNMNLRGEVGKLIITSASRHTDPVFYATEIINTLRENFNKPLTDPTRINVLELWSKHDGIPIQNILEACKKYRVAPMVSFSITTLGNTTFEPGVMKADDLLDNIQKLINVGILDPRTTTFRIDPILVGVTSVQQLQHVIERGVLIGVRKFVTSPVQTYSTNPKRNVIPYIDKAIKADSDAIIKYSDAVTQDGSYNWMKYYGLHYDQMRNPGAIAFVPKKEYMKPYADMFLEMMAKHGILIQSCAVKIEGLTPSACLDPEIIEAITTMKTESIVDKTRPFCRCYGVHDDMFRYNDECKSSCVYCYAGQMKTDPFDYYDENGKLKDFSYSKVNTYEQKEEGPAEVVILNKKYVYNNGDVVDDNGQPVDSDTKQRVIWKRAVDINRAKEVKVDGIWYVVSNTGIIFNWGASKVEQFGRYDDLKKRILRAANTEIYNKPVVDTIFNAKELKELGESRKKFCKV